MRKAVLHFSEGQRVWIGQAWPAELFWSSPNLPESELSRILPSCTLFVLTKQTALKVF